MTLRTPPLTRGDRPRRRYVLVDLMGFEGWIPTSDAQPMLDLAVAEGTKAPNATVAAVLRHARQHGAPPPEELFDPGGAFAVFCPESFLAMPRAVSCHRTADGAARAAQRRNALDPGTVYAVALRADVWAVREAALTADGV
jgi:hypothetical protein